MSVDTTKLQDQVKTLQQKELTRLVSELKFLNNIDTSSDKLSGKLSDSLYADSAVDLNAKTTLTSDHDLAQSLIENGTAKTLNPALANSMSDVNNTQPGDSVAAITGNSDDANIVNQISNQSSDINSTGLTYTPGGTLAQAVEDNTGLMDTATQAQQKAFNAVSTVLAQDPTSAVAGALLGKIDTFGGDANALVVQFMEFNDRIVEVADLAVGIDSSYYALARDGRIRNARVFLSDADRELLFTRAELVENDAFDEWHYNIARNDVKQAANALVDYGNPPNKIIQIKGLLALLDFLMNQLNQWYSMYMDELNALREYFNSFIQKMLYNGPMLAMINHVEAEVRSIIRSMDLVLAVNQPLLYLAKERVWWMQCLLLEKKMWITPQNVVNFLTKGLGKPYLDAYDPIANQLKALSFSNNLQLLQDQLMQMKYLVSRKLESNEGAILIISLRNQIQSDNLDRVDNINVAVGIADSYDPPPPPPGHPIDPEVPQLMDSTLRDAGLDRAADALKRGDWTTFAQLDTTTGSYAGQTRKTIDDTITAAQADPNVTYNSLQSLWEAQRYVYNVKRSQDALAETFGIFKNDAMKNIVKFDIPQVKTLGINTDQFVEEANRV